MDIKARFKCQTCDMVFLSEDNLKIHDKKKIICKQCTFDSCTISRLYAHILKVHGTQKIKSEMVVSPKLTKNKTEKATKEKITTENKTEKTFSQVTMTEIIRGDSTFYGCSICDSKFVRKERMEKHINSTSGAAKQCDQCKYTNCSDDGLTKHKLKKHPINEVIEVLDDLGNDKKQNTYLDKNPAIETEKVIKAQTKHTMMPQVKKNPNNKAIEVLDHLGKDKKQNKCVDKKPIIEAEKIVKTQKKDTAPPQGKENPIKESIEALDCFGQDKIQSIRKTKIYFSCDNCDQTFYNKSDKQNHTQNFDGIIKTCNQCEYKSCHTMGLNRHKNKIHKNKVDKKSIETEKVIKTQTKHTPLQQVKKTPINEAIEVLDRFGKDKKQNTSISKKPVIETEKVNKTQAYVNYWIH